MAKSKVNPTPAPGSSPTNPVVMYRAPVIDTTGRRNATRNLTDALYGYLTMDLDEMELAAKAQAAAPSFQMYTPEMLVQATEEVNRIRERVDKARATLGSQPQGLREIMELGILVPMEGMLRQAEARVSSIQAELEG